MRPRPRSHRQRARAFACAASATLAGGGEARADGIVVEVTAPASRGPTAFVIVCDGVTRREVTPARLSFPGGELACEIRAEAPLEVVARSSGGSIVRSATSGGVMRLHLR
jgi:hypothetical protein